ncbi:MAG: alpha/beta fold hydrolase [Paracoccaceae bacterium]
MALFQETEALASGFLPDEDGHAVFWETFGTPDRPAILLLHGGPGGGCSDRLPRLFDPDRWFIVTMDQRGCGRSTPHAGDTRAALEANTTAHLVSDIERLREALSLDRWCVYGASWGVTLAQAYAHAHLDRVTGLILGSVTSTSQFEIDNLYGGAGAYLPEAFDAFQAGAPEGTPGVGMAEAYYHRLMSDDPAVHHKAAADWCRWEAAVLKVDPRAEPSDRFAEPRFALCFARIVTHYFRHLAWLDPPLLQRAGALRDVPSVLINSRLDLSCPLSTAWTLHKAWPRSKLMAMPGALHGTLYGPLATEIVAAGNAFADMFEGQR